ncbi:DNA translocase FtsK [Holdemania massiliensis]|uniref:DNA translocase FtsK n=1 Tax=Holdemania massiliensis TaxID=1468449 RepID=UPI001F050F7E|nr:DNA translocase FtsK [Holdemania massiliensis]
MAKTKQKKKKNNSKSTVDSEILRYVIALAVITVTLIAALQLGIVGQFLTTITRYLFGTYYGVVYGMCLLGGLAVLFGQRFPVFSVKTLIAIAAVFIAMILWSAIPQDPQLSGFRVFSDYLSHTGEHFSSPTTVAAQGGVLGALLYSLSSLLFARTGTVLVIFALLALAALLMIKTEVYVSMWHSITDALHREKKPKAKRSPRQMEIEELEESGENRRVIGSVELGKKKKKSIFLTPDDEPAEAELSAAPIVKKEKKKEEKEKPVPPPEEMPKVVSIGSGAGEVGYTLPALTMLDEIQAKSRSVLNQNAASIKGKKLIEVLGNFGINAQLVATHIGPAVTKFEIRPDSNVKVSKINAISDNLKMELAARDIRIEAPIPGRNAVGIEIPNVETTPVKMLELMRQLPEDKKDKKLLLALGKDLMGKGIFCQLDKMPHLLIAGATGSGKSVCMNTIITSLLLRTSPDEVKLLLVDPKKVEFTPYREIPHLIGPVISDGAEAARALKVIVMMMENRYEVFAQVGVRNIAGYNEKLAKEPQPNLQPMPYIVVIIDELADLMAVAGKEVEMSIQRITQLARAAGIHLIVATQRPSTDVITGIIKANIPSRIAFSVSSGIDSRTILDHVGAERLLGNGDMLYFPIGEPSPVRLQGVYVTDDEVKRITDFVSAQMKPRYEDAFIRLEGVDNNESTAVMSAQDDPLYEEVREYVIETQKASTSLLQRRFGIGYNRAARLIDVLEERGIIGPVQGSKPRDVYIKKNETSDDEEEN